MRASDFVAYRLPNSEKIVLLRGNFVPAETVLNENSVFCVKPFDGNGLFALANAESIDFEDKTNLELALPNYPDSDICKSHEDFVLYVQEAKDAISDNQFEKAVVARKEFRSVAIRPWNAFNKALDAYPDAFVYLLHSEVAGTWLGASPELLLEFDGEKAKTVALAGTVKGNEGFSIKETNEQGIIGKYLHETLTQCEATHIQTSTARPDVNGGLVHLKSDVAFQIQDKNKLQLINRLHPTPAVGGYPKQAALEFIARFEKNGRELYAGWLGYLGMNTTQLFVNLRCARLYADGAVLHAGCGINSMSNPEKEWQETCWKMDVIGRCI